MDDSQKQLSVKNVKHYQIQTEGFKNTLSYLKL